MNNRIKMILRHSVVSLYCLQEENKFYFGIPLHADHNWLFLQGISQDGEDEGLGIINMEKIHQIELDDEYGLLKRRMWTENGNVTYHIPSSITKEEYIYQGIGMICKVKIKKRLFCGTLVEKSDKFIMIKEKRRERIRYDDIVWLQISRKGKE